MTPRQPPARARGTTLIEVVAFIVILALVVTGLVSAFTGALRTTGMPREINQGLQLAQSRMELILGRRERLGFTGFLASYDPCSDQPTCATATRQACACPTGYTVTVSPLAQTYSSGDANYRTVTVTVTGGIEGGQLAQLVALVASY